jgi:hypothetical protein
MKLQLIHTENYLLVVDESEIKEGETGLSINNAVYTETIHLLKLITMKYNEQDIVLTISFYNEIKEDYFIFSIWRTIYETHDKYDTRHDEAPCDVPIKMEDIYWDETLYSRNDNQFIESLLKNIPDLIDAKFLDAYHYFLRNGKQDKTEVVIMGYEMDDGIIAATSSPGKVEE